MDQNQISRADILDIIFDGRNKEYGAYQLRKTYNGRLARSLSMMGGFCLLLIGGYTLAGKTGKSAGLIPTTEVSLASVKTEQPVVIPPVAKPQTQQIATIRNTIPRIVPADQVKPDDAPPPVEDLENARIGTVNTKGAADDGINAGPPSTGTGLGNVVAAPEHNDEDNTVFRKVEIESQYPEGAAAWIRFLSKNYHVPEEAISTDIAGTVTIEFIVDKEGNVSDVHAVSGPEVLQAEAIRVIKKSGKWTPAIQNGRQVNSYKRQPITVRLSND